MKVVVDFDPGVDDSMALFLLLSSPVHTVVGLTIVHGNSTNVCLLEKNCRFLLYFAER